MPTPNLVFASGFLVPQKIAGLDYFKGLPALYPPETTLFAPTSVLGSVQLRAAELAKAIAVKFPIGEIHIVAHSMGGLDARCILANDVQGLASRVKSVSTISTPHHGSSVANLLLGEPIGLEFPFRDLLAQFAPVSVHGLLDLCTTAAPGFKAVDPVKGVQYFSYAGDGLASALLFPTHAYLDGVEGNNDGLVSVASATWPEALAEDPWDTDHFGEIGYDLNRPDLATSFDFVAAIARVVKRATS